MKIVFLTTSSGETEKYAESLACVNGSKVSLLRYDGPEVTDETLYGAVRDLKPAMVVYIGTRWGPQPSILFLAKLNDKVAPTVHICSDAADPPWHDLLADYHKAGAFALQVAIDGNPRWPLAETARGMTLLTPINASHFGEMRPHALRHHVCGYAGNAGAEGSVRRDILMHMMMRNLVRMRMREGGNETYADMCEFMKQCRMTLNISYTGTQAAKHVKGRVLEAGLAGSCLLEVADTPTSAWFKPGVDYLPYNTVDELMQIVNRLAVEPEETQAIGARLRTRVLTEHSPAVFWRKIMERVGVWEKSMSS